MNVYYCIIMYVDERVSLYIIIINIRTISTIVLYNVHHWKTRGNPDVIILIKHPNFSLKKNSMELLTQRNNFPNFSLTCVNLSITKPPLTSRTA